MNVVKHTKYVWELEDFIPHDEIDYFLGMFDFYDLDFKEDFRNKERQNDTYVISEHAEHADLDELAWKWINHANQYYIENNKWIYYNWQKDDLIAGNTKWSGQNIVRIYHNNDTYYWHGDQSPQNHPEFSYILYLNDDFEGGKTRFLNDRLTVNPKKGTVLCFPVDHYHIHKGTRVTAGTKKIVWNCVFRHEIQMTMTVKQPYLTATDVPRSSKRCIW